VQLALAGVIGFGATSTLSETPAHADVGCYGDYCSGQDPEATHCVDDAKTLAWSEFKVISYIVDSDGTHEKEDDLGRIELRGSEACKTKWARETLRQSTDTVYEVVAKQDTGYFQTKKTIGWVGSTQAGVFYTPMIYSPRSQVYARVDGHRLESNTTDWK
jgi:hypothetical protein